MDKPENWLSCGVCAERTRFCYLKAQLCRACASFFRRAVTENIKYTCQFEDKCKLDWKRRNICPACRFAKCRQMNPILKKEKRRLDKNDGSNESTIQPTNQPQNSAILPLQSIESNQVIQSNCLFFNESVLDALMSGYSWYCEEERQLHVIKHPEFDFSRGRNMLIKNRKIPIQMEIRCLPLMLSMFNDYYRAFPSFTISQQIKLTASIAYEIHHLHKAFLTSNYFKSVNDKRMSITGGYYVCHNKIDINGYVYGLFMSRELEDFINIYQPISTRRFNNFRKFKQLQLGKRDAVCMMFLTLCRHIEYMGMFNGEFERLRERVLGEWYSKIKDEHGIAESPERFTQIFNYYLETNVLNNDFTKILTVLSLNNNRPDIVPLHDSNGCAKKLSEQLEIQLN